MSRRSHSIRWTREQLDQHTLLGRRLQSPHARAAQALMKLVRLRTGQVQHEAVCNELVDLVHSIGLLIACCETIRASGFRPKYTVVRLVHVNVCEFCLANPKSRRRDDGNLLEADPAWGIQVETLLRLIALTTFHIVERCSSPHWLKKSSRCLADLNKIILREQRHLRSLERWPVPRIEEVSDYREVCKDCGHRFVNTSFKGTGDAVDVSSPEIQKGSG
jgi:hypothetical protein